MREEILALYEKWRSLPAMFYERAAERGSAPFVWAKREGAYAPHSWAEIAAKARALASGLRALGVAPGDRVVVVSENRPEWVIADLAVMSAGAYTVPAYTTNTARDHRHILLDSEAKAAIVSNRDLAARLLPAVTEAPSVRFVVAIDEIGGAGTFDTPIHSWPDVLGRTEEAGEIEGIVARLDRDDVACLIYTSGTGGDPKGVMLSHANMLADCKGAFRVLDDLGLGHEVFLSFLPLSHSYEHTCGLYFPISVGGEIFYAESAEQLATNMREAEPTVMISVPRLYEVMRQRILAQLRRERPLRRRLFEDAVRLGRKAYEAPERMTLMERMQNRLLERLVRNRVRARFGGRLKAMISGGAPLQYEAGIFFTALGLRLLQGYGQTEAAPVISCNLPTGFRIDTVGPPLVDVEVKIARDGEILVRGPVVMKGYWQRPELTAEVLRGGWLHTGDVGTIEPDGHLRITDRKKDIIVLSGGDNVWPQHIEGTLALRPEIAQAMVYGDGRPHLVALIVPDAEFLSLWAKANGRTPDLGAVAGDEALRRALAPAVHAANLDLSTVERVKRFAVARQPFSVDNGQLTPTLKVRRHRIIAAYREVLDALYGEAAGGA